MINTNDHKQSPKKVCATVELNSPYLIAFDLPSEGVKYKLSNFIPGIYRIPLEAIVKASGSNQIEEKYIEVDTGVIYFIEADFEDNFRNFENQLFEETGDSYEMTENPEKYSESVGIKFDCLLSSGVGSGYDFVGDGSYILDVSKIEKI